MEIKTSKKRDRFVRNAERRTATAVRALRAVGRLSKTSLYEYTEAEAQQIKDALALETAAVLDSFTTKEKKRDDKFFEFDDEEDDAPGLERLGHRESPGRRGGRCRDAAKLLLVACVAMGATRASAIDLEACPLDAYPTDVAIIVDATLHLCSPPVTDVDGGDPVNPQPETYAGPVTMVVEHNGVTRVTRYPTGPQEPVRFEGILWSGQNRLAYRHDRIVDGTIIAGEWLVLEPSFLTPRLEPIGRPGQPQVVEVPRIN